MQKTRADWHAYRRVPASFMPREWQTWVLDTGSLTKRLQQVSKGDFRVRVRKQRWALPYLSERKVLGLSTREHALVREVDLLCHDDIWVQARSIVPLATLSGAERQLNYLGERPLGAFLFSSKSMRRGPLELFRQQSSEGMSYSRRSVFSLHGKPLLVTERFLPRVLSNFKA